MSGLIIEIMKRPFSMPWHVYIIECRDHTLYTGVTNDLYRRVNDHNKGNGGKYTRFRWPVKLIHSEEHPTKSEAQKREAYIKGLTREKKFDLCRLGDTDF